MDKDKIISKVKDSFNKVKETSKQIITQSTIDANYIKESHRFKILKEDDKTKRYIFSIFDISSNVMYFKEIDKFFFLEFYLESVHSYNLLCRISIYCSIFC